MRPLPARWGGNHGFPMIQQGLVAGRINRDLIQAFDDVVFVFGGGVFVRTHAQSLSVQADNLARVQDVKRIHRPFDLSHNVPSGAVFGGHVIQLAHSYTMFACYRAS